MTRPHSVAPQAQDELRLDLDLDIVAEVSRNNNLNHEVNVSASHATIEDGEEQPENYFFAHVLRAPIFGHFLGNRLVKLFSDKAVFSAKVVSKITKGKQNINTTLLAPKISEEGDVAEGLKINTYADSTWKDQAGILFNRDSHFLGFYPGDIGSVGFSGFAKDGATTPEIMSNMNNWARNSSLEYHRGNSIKITPHGATDKLQEIAFRRNLDNPDNSTTKYFDIDGNQIYTGLKDKFHQDMFDGLEKYPIPQDRLRHNETHIKTNISDVVGLFVTKDSWENSSYKALYTLNEAYLAIKQRRAQVLENPVLVEGIKKSILGRIKYYQDAIRLMEQEKAEFNGCLIALENGDEVKNKKMDQAFKRKKNKYPRFDADNLENKKIWLGKHIANAERNIGDLQEMIAKSQQECNENAIMERLRVDPKIYVYDANKGLLEEVDHEAVQEKVASASFFKRTKDVAIKPTAAVVASFLRLAKNNPIDTVSFLMYLAVCEVILAKYFLDKQLIRNLSDSGEVKYLLATAEYAVVFLGGILASVILSSSTSKAISYCRDKISDSRASRKVHPQINNPVPEKEQEGARHQREVLVAGNDVVSQGVDESVTIKIPERSETPKGSVKNPQNKTLKQAPIKETAI